MKYSDTTDAAGEHTIDKNTQMHMSLWVVNKSDFINVRSSWRLGEDSGDVTAIEKPKQAVENKDSKWKTKTFFSKLIFLFLSFLVKAKSAQNTDYMFLNVFFLLFDST